jgi:hypothetical protein
VHGAVMPRKGIWRRYISPALDVFLTHWLLPLIGSAVAASILCIGLLIVCVAMNLMGVHVATPILRDCDDVGAHCTGRAYSPPLFNGFFVGAMLGIFFTRQHFTVWGAAKDWVRWNE